MAVVSGWVAITRSMPPTAKALTFLEMLARFSLRRHRKANAYRDPGLFRDLRLLDEQRPPESRPYLTTRSYGSTKGPRSAHIGLGRAAQRRMKGQTCATDRQTGRKVRDNMQEVRDGKYTITNRTPIHEYSLLPPWSCGTHSQTQSFLIDAAGVPRSSCVTAPPCRLSSRPCHRAHSSADTRKGAG